jgi:hypothetical protein
MGDEADDGALEPVLSLGISIIVLGCNDPLDGWEALEMVLDVFRRS